MKHKLLLSLFAGVLSLSMIVTPVFAENPVYGGGNTTGNWYAQDIENVEQGDPDGYVYGGGSTTGNFYAEDIEDQYNNSSDNGSSNSSDSSDKKSDSNKKEDTDEKKEETSSEANSEDTSGGGEEETEFHGKDNPYKDLAKDSINSCRISSSIEIPDGFEYNIHTLIENLETEEYYLISQTAADDHTGHIYAPAGSYKVIEIAVDNDEDNDYPITRTTDETFDLETGATYSIEGTFDRYDEINEATNGASTEDETADPDGDAVDSSEENDDGDGTDITTEDGTVIKNADIVPDIMPWRVVSQSGKGPMISYDGLATGAYTVNIKITHSGPIGEAKYIMNFGYGTTEEALVPETLKIVAEGKGQDGSDIDTGLTITFPEGEYKIDTVYTFSTLREWQVDKTQQGTGVVYMGGVPEVDASYVYLIKVVEPGALGQATYVMSIDNGETWSNETVTPSNGRLEVNNVTIQMTTGTYETGDLFYADIVGVGKPDYSNIVIAAVVGIALVALGTVSVILIKKKSGKDKYDIV